jgi:fructose-bisphosphate aldolase class I
MNTLGQQTWNLTFSYGRALQATAMKTWAGKPENLSTASAAFMRRARCNAAASLGEWREELEHSTD